MGRGVEWAGDGQGVGHQGAGDHTINGTDELDLHGQHTSTWCMLGAMPRRLSSAFDPTVLHRLRHMPEGGEPSHYTLSAFQGWIKHHPEWSEHAMEAVERHLPHWTKQQQVAVGVMLFPKGGAVRERFIAALGQNAGVVSRTLEQLVVQPGNETGFEAALVRVSGLGELERRHFVSIVLTRALQMAMGPAAQTALLATMAKCPQITDPEIFDTLGLDYIFTGWWSCVIASRHDLYTPWPIRQGEVERAITVLLDAGIPLQREGEPCGGVACALWFQDEDALGALLARGAEWEGLEPDERGRAMLERQPAWRRRALGCGLGEIRAEETNRRQI